MRKSDLPAPARLIIFVLADVADNQTGLVPEDRTLSLSELARQTGLGRSTVAEHLDGLEKSGWVRRDQPTAQEARAGKKTRYRIKVGTSPGAGLVQELDHQPSPGAGPEVVQELDHPSPGAGRKNKTPSKDPSKPSKTTGASAPRRQGTRIPDDFTVTPEMIAWARENTPLVGARETEAFVDYWRATPGARGVKLDWAATWRNWMRRAQADASARAGRRSPVATGQNRYVNNDRPDANPFANGANAIVASQHTGGRA